MPLNDLRKRTLFLAGAVPIPNPIPELGKIRIDPQGIRFERSENCSESVLYIEHVIPPSLAVARAVRLRDVAAVFIPRHARKAVDLEDGEWLFGPDISQIESVEQVCAPGTDRMGIVYLPESAPVLMRSEFGTTAGESANFYLAGPSCDPTCCRWDCESDCSGDGSCDTDCNN